MIRVIDWSVREQALVYADHGWPVLPIRPPQRGASESGKEPYYHEHDCADGAWSATTSAALIERWWRRWPRAGVGIALGQVSGLLVLDDDDPDPTLLRDPPTACVVTSRGLHYYYGKPNDAVPSTWRSTTFHREVRGDGQYVVAPPSRHASGHIYYWQTISPILPLPAALQQRPPEPHRQIIAPRTGRSPTSRTIHDPHRYATSTLERLLRELRSAPVGRRNTVLNWCAFRCGQFVAQGWLDEQDVAATLHNTARHCGLTVRETERTIRSGLRAGITPDRQQR